MHLVDEQDIAFVQVGQNGRQVAGPLDGGSGRGLHGHTHLVGQDVRQRRFAHMVQRLAALLGGLQENLQVIAQAVLSDHLGQTLWPQGGVQRGFFGAFAGGNSAVVHGGDWVIGCLGDWVIG